MICSNHGDDDFGNYPDFSYVCPKCHLLWCFDCFMGMIEDSEDEDWHIYYNNQSKEEGYYCFSCYLIHQPPTKTIVYSPIKEKEKLKEFPINWREEFYI
jgi:hypothetical protein